MSGERPQRTGSRSLTTSPRNVYATKDGRYIAISASIQAMAERVFRAIGRPEMIDDPRFRTNTDRVRHIDECDGAVAEFIAERTLDENMAVFQAAEVTATPVYEIDQLVADEHIQERGVIVEAPDEEAGSVLMHNVIPRLSGTPGKLRRAGTGVGAAHARGAAGDRVFGRKDCGAGGGWGGEGGVTRRDRDCFVASLLAMTFAPRHCEERSDEAISVTRGVRPDRRTNRASRD